MTTTNYANLLSELVSFTSTADPLERAKDTVEWFMTGYNPRDYIDLLEARDGTE